MRARTLEDMAQQPITSTCSLVPERAVRPAPAPGRLRSWLHDRAYAWRHLHERRVAAAWARAAAAGPLDADVRRVAAELQFRSQED